MSYSYTATRTYESEAFPGVVYHIRKMTEGRRFDLRARLAEPTRKMRDLMKAQESLGDVAGKDTDYARWLEIQDQIDEISVSIINPEWVKWGVKQLDGLVVDNAPLGLDDWQSWPSALFHEVLEVIKSEAELNGSERKNSKSPTISGEPEGGSQSSSTVESADEKVTGEIGTVGRSIQVA